jgi:hypothetical protein
MGTNICLANWCQQRLSSGCFLLQLLLLLLLFLSLLLFNTAVLLSPSAAGSNSLRKNEGRVFMPPR